MIHRKYGVEFVSWLMALGLLTGGIGGAFLPWIWEQGVALQLTGPGLAEFVKFLPEVRLGQVQVQRLYFLLPLFVAMLGLPLVSVNRAVTLPGWLRWLLRLAVFPLALASLSPVWTPAILTAPEFRLQTILALTAMGLAVVGPLLTWIPFKLLALLMAIAAATAIVLPLQAFNLVKGGIAQAYHHPVSLGWGWQLTALGLACGIIGGILSALSSLILRPQNSDASDGRGDGNAEAAEYK